MSTLVAIGYPDETTAGLAAEEVERLADDLIIEPDAIAVALIRQRIESIFNTAKSQLSLERHGGRTAAGVMARVAQRVLALAAAIWHNWATDAPVKRSLIAYDH